MAKERGVQASYNGEHGSFRGEPNPSGQANELALFVGAQNTRLSTRVDMTTSRRYWWERDEYVVFLTQDEGIRGGQGRRSIRFLGSTHVLARDLSQAQTLAPAALARDPRMRAQLEAHGVIPANQPKRR
jgi:hypothetical protein